MKKPIKILVTLLAKEAVMEYLEEPVCLFEVRKTYG
jgi:hypothetical protein